MFAIPVFHSCQSSLVDEIWTFKVSLLYADTLWCVWWKILVFHIPDSYKTSTVLYAQLQKCRGKHRSPYKFNQIITYNVFKNCGELFHFNCLKNYWYLLALFWQNWFDTFLRKCTAYSFWSSQECHQPTTNIVINNSAPQRNMIL